MATTLVNLDDVCTLDKIREAIDSVKPTPYSSSFYDYTLPKGWQSGGMRLDEMDVFITDNLPKKMIGHWIEARTAPKWFAFILRLFDISPVVWIREPMYQEQSYRCGSVYYMSPYMWNMIKKDTRLVNVSIV